MTVRVKVTRCILGLAYMQVCAVRDATDTEVLEVCNIENPSGTLGGWVKVHHEEGPLAPIACEDRPNRWHLIISC